MRVRIMQWARTKYDTRQTASSQASGEIECKNAVAVARDLDTRGEQSVYAAYLTLRSPGARLATGHGVTIQYANGKLRTVREWSR
jgi:hypothetical protein